MVATGRFYRHPTVLPELFFDYHSVAGNGVTPAINRLLSVLSEDFNIRFLRDRQLEVVVGDRKPRWKKWLEWAIAYIRAFLGKQPAVDRSAEFEARITFLPIGEVIDMPVTSWATYLHSMRAVLLYLDVLHPVIGLHLSTHGIHALKMPLNATELARLVGLNVELRAGDSLTPDPVEPTERELVEKARSKRTSAFVRKFMVE